MWYQIILITTILNTEAIMSSSRPFYSEQSCQEHMIVNSLPRIEEHPDVSLARGVCVYIEDSDGI